MSIYKSFSEYLKDVERKQSSLLFEMRLAFNRGYDDGRRGVIDVPFSRTEHPELNNSYQFGWLEGFNFSKSLGDVSNDDQLINSI